MDLNQYYNYIIQRNGQDLSAQMNSPWGIIAGAATPILTAGAVKLGQEIQMKRNSRALRPENIDGTINNIVSGDKYNKFVENATDLARFQNNPGYDTAAAFDSNYAGARQKIFDNWLSGTIDTDTYINRVQDLNTNTTQNRQVKLNKDYSGLTSKYKGAQGFNNLQTGIDQKLNLDIGARTNFDISTPSFQQSFKPQLGDTFQPLKLDLPQLELPKLDFTGNSILGQQPLSTQPQINGQSSPNLGQQSSTQANLPVSTSSTSSFLNNMKTAGAGALGGMVAGMGVNALGNLLGANKSKAGQMATGVVSQIIGNIGSTVGSNLVSGASAFSNLGSSLTSVSNLAQGGMGLANIALDVFDPVKKSKAENITNIGLGAAGLGAALAGAGPVGWTAGGLLLAGNILGHAFGQKTESFTSNKDLLAQTNGSYGGSTDKILTAESLAGKKYSLWNNSGRHKADEKIFEAKRQQNTINNVIGYNNDRRDIAQSNSGILHTGREMELAGGYNLTGTRSGKQGMVIQKRSEIFLTKPTDEFKDGGSLSKEPTFIELVTIVDEFQQGGSINVIPEGALHARKHNMNIEGITTKGIPVVSEKEGGELEQQAEIEKEEIIFRLEVTKKLEELAKDGSDEAAIEAGKLLVNEILYNTDDRTNNLL